MTPEKAFPIQTSYTTNLGMSLRDYFAAKAMQSLIAGLFTESGGQFGGAAMEELGFRYDECNKLVSKVAFEYADAMLAEREKGTP